MSKTIISLKIDVTKIDKNRLFTSKKTGAVYLDAIVFLDDAADQYGNNGMITQQVSKEERMAGTKGAILGNCKIVSSKQSAAGSSGSASAQNNNEDDDLPF